MNGQWSPLPAERAGEGGLADGIVEAGEAEDVTAGHLDRLHVQAQTDRTDDVR